MVRCPVTFYKCSLAQFCRFFYARPTQSSCGRNSVSATSLVREFSCGRCRHEQQSSTGGPQPRLEFGQVPPPTRCPRDVFAPLQVIVSARRRTVRGGRSFADTLVASR